VLEIRARARAHPRTAFLSFPPFHFLLFFFPINNAGYCGAAPVYHAELDYNPFSFSSFNFNFQPARRGQGEEISRARMCPLLSTVRKYLSPYRVRVMEDFWFTGPDERN
jgi:hypothetical protein